MMTAIDAVFYNFGNSFGLKSVIFYSPRSL